MWSDFLSGFVWVCILEILAACFVFRISTFRKSSSPFCFSWCLRACARGPSLPLATSAKAVQAAVQPAMQPAVQPVVQAALQAAVQQAVQPAAQLAAARRSITVDTAEAAPTHPDDFAAPAALVSDSSAFWWCPSLDVFDLKVSVCVSSYVFHQFNVFVGVCSRREALGERA